MTIEEISVDQFLAFKEGHILNNNKPGWIFELDISPFNREFPKLKELHSIGHGVEFLNRRLSSQLFEALQGQPKTIRLSPDSSTRKYLYSDLY